MTDITEIQNEPEDSLHVKWPFERIRKYLIVFLLLAFAISTVVALILAFLASSPAILISLPVLITIGTIVGLGMIFGGDWLYERRYFFRIKANEMAINREEKTATIKLNAIHNRITWTWPWDWPSLKQKEPYEFSWKSYLNKLDTENSPGRRNSEEIKAQNNLVVENLLESWDLQDEPENNTSVVNKAPSFTTPLLTAPLKVKTVNVIVDIENPATQSSDTVAAINKNIKGMRTLLADLLSREPMLETIHYEVQQNGVYLFSMSFGQSAKLTGYELTLKPSEIEKPGVAEAVYRFLKKDILSNHLQGIKGLSINQLPQLSRADKSAYKKLSENYFSQRDVEKDYLYTPQLSKGRRGKPNFLKHTWQQIINVFNTKETAENYQNPARPNTAPEGAITYNQSSQYAYEILAAGSVDDLNKMTQLFEGYTSEINKTESEEALDKICNLVLELKKIRNRSYLKCHPDKQKENKDNTYDLGKIKEAYAVLAYALLAQGVYGNTLKQVQMLKPGEELTQNQDQRAWGGIRAKIQKEALAKARQLLEDSKKELEDTNKELEDTNKELEDTNKELEDTNKELEYTDKELEDTNKELEYTDKELEAADKELKTAQKELETALKEKKAALKEKEAAQQELQGKLKAAAERRFEEFKARIKHTTPEDMTSITKNPIFNALPNTLSPSTPNNTDNTEAQAATKIQAAFRGYLVRSR